MQRGKFSREFNLQAVKLVREAEADRQSAFPGNGQMKP